MDYEAVQREGPMVRWAMWSCVAMGCVGASDATERLAGGSGDSIPVTPRPAPPDPPPTIRLVTWNVATLGEVGSDPYVAVRDVLARLDADVVGLNELEEVEESRLARLASELDYSVAQIGRDTPFGSLRNGILVRSSRRTRSWTSAALSDDASAEDLTRRPVSTVVDAPWGGSLGVVVQHCKAGFDDVDEFRRLVDALRTAQAGRSLGVDHVVVLGDFNEDPVERQSTPLRPATFRSVPSGVPGSYRLGADLRATLEAEGLVNDPFRLVADLGLAHVPLAQLDGRVESRDSGRWIDHVFLDGTLRVVASEIYDARDEGRPGGVPKSGEAPVRYVTSTASDHLPVVVDLTISE